MLKKLIFIGYVVTLCLILFACKKNSSTDLAASENQNNESVDLDLTKMNYNMLSSITFDVLIAPKKYADKRVKTSGTFHTAFYEGQRYYSVLNWDATGCCPAGFDFIPMDSMTYPDDFPENDAKITVTGTLKYANESKDSLIFQAENIIQIE